jgi:predicted DNA-binding transcriptional regulator AlpA
MATTFERKTVSIQEAIEISGLSRSSIFKLLNSGDLASVTVLSRRLVVLESLCGLLTPSD